MSQQGEKPAAHEDDWWRKLYDESAPDTGPSRAADSLDDRFDSVSDTVSGPADTRRTTARETVRDPYGDAYEDPFADRYESPDSDGYEGEGPYTDRYEPPGPDREAYRLPSEQGRSVVAQREPGGGPDPGAARDPSPGPGAAPGPSTAAGLSAAPGPAAAAAAAPDPGVARGPSVNSDPSQVPGPARVPDLGVGPGRSPAPDPSAGPASAPPAPVPAVIPDPSVPAGPVQDLGPARSPRPTQDPDPAQNPDPAQDPRPARAPGPAEAPAPPVTAAPAPAPVPDPRVAPPTPPPPPTAPRTTPFPAPWEAPGGQAGPRTFAVPRVPGPAEAEGDASAQVGLAADPSSLHELPPQPTVDAGVRPAVAHLGDRPPTYDAEPAALPSATSENLEGLVPDTVLDGARYGTYTLRAASVRGDSARFRGEPRRDGLLTARFGAAESALVLVAVAGGRRDGEAAHLAAADACRWIGGAVARSHLRLSEDIRAGRRGDLKSGLHRLTDRTYGKLRARAAELGVEPDAYTASLRCLLLSADPDCRTRVFFGVGSGGLFRLRDGLWQDLEPFIPEGGGPAARPGDEPEAGPDGDRLTMDLQITGPASPNVEGPPQPPAQPFRFRASVARPGDTLMLCSNGLAEPMRGEPALPGELAERWGSEGPPGLPAFLADTQLRIKGYADDRTCAAVWEA
ncbi:protein phosphatase 2C domain-containing protein [Streptomyces sp. PTY087I2]|uniref:protein phosphatase 2C domain-containing protein n=1 Tax=Streptomyces sp. PTY087I2 TaxID=1819298 RepID=UPI00080BF4B7|nr:protein phosphatase 2C domain-containing protein [Streptomyces sp. PTY087I2]